MFEGSVSSIPSILAYMNSWLNPHFFFLLLNLMIGTIAFTSTFNNHRQQQSTTTVPIPTPTPSKESDDPSSPIQTQDSDTHLPQTLKPLNPQKTNFQEEEEEEEEKEEKAPTTLDDDDDVYVDQTMVNKLIRTEPEPAKESSEIPVKKEKRMKKSVSTKAEIITHLEASKEEEETIEAQRPATMREGKGKKTVVVEKDEYGVDEKADDFINRFKQQLMLQRMMDSIGRQREFRVKK